MNNKMNGPLFVAILIVAAILGSGILTQYMGLLTAGIVLLTISIVITIVRQIRNPRKPDAKKEKVSWLTNVLMALSMPAAVLLGLFLFVGVLYWFFGAEVWLERKYEAYKPVEQSWELKGGERLSGNEVVLRVAVRQGEKITFAWFIDCAATGLPADCNDWPTRTGDNMCDFSRVVGGPSGQFVAHKAMNAVVLAKTPTAYSTVSTPCVPQNDAYIRMQGRVWWQADAYGGGQ